MKNTHIALAIAVTAALSTSAAFATGGQVNFTGNITDAVCEVANSPSAPLQVPMGDVSKTEFDAAGATAAPQGFTLVLRNCPVTAHNAMIEFDGTSVTGNNAILALTPVAGVATNVGIQISDDTNTVVPLYTASKGYPLSSTNDNELKFVARYISTDTTVSPGSADATANFSVTYN